MEKKDLIYDLFLAYYDARKNKRNTKDQVKFEYQFEQYLFALADDLYEWKYQISPSIFFIQNHPVKREVFASPFRDRVVHHLIYNKFIDIFEKWFIHDSYSCRVGKWTHFWVKRVEYFLKSASKNYTKDCYILKLDIQWYFMSMNKEILFQAVINKLQKHTIEDFEFRKNLIKTVIFHDYTKNALFHGKKEDYIWLPKSKSLFFTPVNCGLPIWNLTSQLFSNIYLDVFDKYVKHELQCYYYGRYVDDFVIVHEDRDFLASLIPKIRNYLQTHLALTLHPKKIYLQHYEHGALFLWAYIKPHRTYIRKRTIWYFIHKLKKLNQEFKENNYKISYDIGNNFLSIVNSYLWMMKHHKSYAIRKKILYHHVSPYFWNYFYISTHFTKIKSKYDNIWKFTSLQNQLWLAHLNISDD